MDASALLAKQGWRGAGHGLGSTGHGIARPLLISNKQDALGLGKKKIQVADQWWMRAYDNGLKELGTGKQTALSSIRQNGMNKGGLYGFFVRGEGMAGTISDSSVGTDPASNSISSPSDNSTLATTPEVDSASESKQPEKKRKREGEKENRRKKRKEDSVTQSKGKGKATRKKDSQSEQALSDGAKPAATEDPKLLRRAAKKALRQKRAHLEAKAKTKSASENDETTDDGKSKSSTDGTTKAKKGKKRRTDAGKGAEPQAAAEATSEASTKDISKKLKKYAAKAAEKGMTVEAYLAKKESEKEKAKK
ncbi:putative DNA-directed RNA polymerase II subunit rpb1 protein [Botryosphaeria dothidea]|uniref:DNA-directed RNA polymerase II subunit rpb1 protein n=1 Tax=Botryosphaeria dothidea TaxID=55169 RepID=A0A8H4IK10_9PEZI|nr:putative DNA-directed RNA polymerase II subunit rpb1 protein [Botryosphaeria dothidea]